MKKIFISFLSLGFAWASNAFAQNSNPWPTSGNVGIGTTSPESKLHIVGGINSLQTGASSSSDQPGLFAFNTPTWGSATNFMYAKLYGSGTTGYYNFGQQLANLAAYTAGGSTNTGVIMGTYGNAPVVIGTADVDRIHINANGNVGIGAESPLSQLQVDDGCSKAAIGDASGSGLNWGTSYLGFNAARSGTNWTIHSDGVYNGGGVIYSNIHGDMYFAQIESTGASSKTLTDADIKSRIKMRITAAGVTYIKAIKVEPTNWPDYVFKKNYRLPSLKEVKSYIDKNQHLPDLPSEAEVAKDGIELGEMNKLLTKKVEELTLYLIEKDQQISDQQTVNKDLKKTNKELQERMSKLEQQLQLISKKLKID